jgi:cytochrome c-550 PedF
VLRRPVTHARAGPACNAAKSNTSAAWSRESDETEREVSQQSACDWGHRLPLMPGTGIADGAADLFQSHPETAAMTRSIPTPRRLVRCTAIGAAVLLAAGLALAHGDVTPQAVDTKDLPPLGDQWRSENPYRLNTKAIAVGTSAYNQNCARCHGLEAISGGVAPDLRKLDNDCSTMKDDRKKAACVKEIDEYFANSVRRGKVRNGAVYMPPFEGIMNQEAIWSIKAYLETRREKPL